MQFKSYILAAMAGLVIGPTLAVGANFQKLNGTVPEAVSRLQLQPIGRLPDTNRLRLAIGLPLRNREQLENELMKIYDPASTNFHHYLTLQQFTDDFGPSERDYLAVIAFAKTHGLNVTATYPNRVLLDVEGALPAIEKAFNAKLHTYQHPSEKRMFYAPDRSLRLI